MCKFVSINYGFRSAKTLISICEITPNPPKLHILKNRLLTSKLLKYQFWPRFKLHKRSKMASQNDRKTTPKTTQQKSIKKNENRAQNEPGDAPGDAPGDHLLARQKPLIFNNNVLLKILKSS